MPMVSQAALDQLKSEVRGLRSRKRGSGPKSGRRPKVQGFSRKKNAMLVGIAEVAGGAALAGWLRGKQEASGREFKLFGVDGELIAGAALLALPLLPKKLTAKIPYKADLANVGIGVLAHYAGQVARKEGTRKPGEALSFVAGWGGGGDPELVGSQFTLPHDGYIGATNDDLYRATQF